MNLIIAVRGLETTTTSFSYISLCSSIIVINEVPKIYILALVKLVSKFKKISNFSVRILTYDPKPVKYFIFRYQILNSK